VRRHLVGKRSVTVNEEIEIKLADEHYERVHKVGKRIEADVLAHAEHVLDVLYGEKREKVKVKCVKVFPNNMKTAILDERGKVIGVWVDPPGICRRPRKGEKFD
jgi:hypothetical protein